MTAVLRRYFRGRKLNTMEDVVAGKKYVFHFDHQGSTQALTDATTGAVTDRFASDAWGVPVKRTGTSLNRNWYIGNSGYYASPRTSGDYVRGRYLSTFLGCWMSRDRFPGELPYAYAELNPAGRIDPGGWQCGDPPDCCPAKILADKRKYAGFCQGGFWARCPAIDDRGLWTLCKKAGDCDLILRAIRGTAVNCRRFCEGATYQPGQGASENVDAMAVCCDQLNRDGTRTLKPCGVLCCFQNGTSGTPRMDPCVRSCLYGHERRHLELCRPDELRSSDECDPYCGQLRCLLDAATARGCVIPAQLQPDVDECFRSYSRVYGPTPCPRVRHPGRDPGGA